MQSATNSCARERFCHLFISRWSGEFRLRLRFGLTGIASIESPSPVRVKRISRSALDRKWLLIESISLKAQVFRQPSVRSYPLPFVISDVDGLLFRCQRRKECVCCAVHVGLSLKRGLKDLRRATGRRLTREHRDFFVKRSRPIRTQREQN